MLSITHVRDAMSDFHAITEFFELNDPTDFSDNFRALTSDVATVAMLTRFDIKSEPQPELCVQTSVITEPEIIHSDQSLTAMLFLDSVKCDIYQASELTLSVKSESNTMIVMDQGVWAQTTDPGRVLIIKLSNIISHVTGRP